MSEPTPRYFLHCQDCLLGLFPHEKQGGQVSCDQCTIAVVRRFQRLCDGGRDVPAVNRFMGLYGQYRRQQLEAARAAMETAQ